MSKTKRTSSKIVNWYLKNARDLPWRKTTDPYKIWISEVVLQQTTVKQGTNYYLRFIKAFPNIKKLATADIDKVLKLWQGLGYYSRARNLHAAAQFIYNENKNVFPNSYEEIIKLKGVGPYTAAAVSSFAFELPHVVVDGNVLRLFSRLYGIKEAIDINSTKTKIQKLAQHLLEKEKASTFNQAIMELGAMVCTYKNPLCVSCPLNKMCLAYKNEDISRIPFKSKKIIRKDRYFKYFFISDTKGNTIIEKRKGKDIWQGLYQLPLQECLNMEEKADLPLDIKKISNISEIVPSKIYKQNLTHQTIYAQFHKIYLNNTLKKNTFDDPYVVIPIEKLNNYAWPKILDLYLNDLSITLF